MRYPNTSQNRPLMCLIFSCRTSFCSVTTVIEDTTCTASALPCPTLQKVRAIALIIVYSVSCRSRRIPPLNAKKIHCQESLHLSGLFRSKIISSSGIDLFIHCFLLWFFFYRLIELAYLISLWLHDMKAYFFVFIDYYQHLLSIHVVLKTILDNRTSQFHPLS